MLVEQVDRANGAMQTVKTSNVNWVPTGPFAAQTGLTSGLAGPSAGHSERVPTHQAAMTTAAMASQTLGVQCMLPKNSWQ